VLLSYDKSVTTFDKVLVALWLRGKVECMTYGLRDGYYKIASQIERFFARMDSNEGYQLDATNYAKLRHTFSIHESINDRSARRDKRAICECVCASKR